MHAFERHRLAVAIIVIELLKAFEVIEVSSQDNPQAVKENLKYTIE